MDVSPSKAMFPMALVAISTCLTLPIGSGAVSYATYNGYLEAYGYTDYQFEFLDMFKGRILILFVVLLYAIFIATKIAPSEPPVPIPSAMRDAKQKAGGKEVKPLDKTHEVLGYGIFILTTLGLIFESKTGIPGWQVTLTGAMLMIVTGVLTADEAIRALPLRIGLMLVGALTVGGAMVSTGLGDKIGEMIEILVGGSHNGYVIGALFFIVPWICTQLMNNNSVMAIFQPVIILSCKTLGCDPRGPLILMMAAALTAYMTPMATGCIPMLMEAGGYDQKSLIKQGWLPALIICVTAVFSVMTIFPAYPN